MRTHDSLQPLISIGTQTPTSANAMSQLLIKACRKATNVSLDAALLTEAKALGINVSQAAEAGLSRAVAERRAALWLTANREAIESSNAYVEQNGLPLAQHRCF